MSQQERVLEKRELAADVYMPVAFRTILLIVVLAVLYFLVGPGRLFPGMQQLLSPFFLPVAASAIAWYLGTLFPIIFEGRMVSTLQDAFVALAIVLFVAITLSAFSDLSGFAVPTLIGGGAFMVYLVGSAYSDWARLAARAVLIQGIGLSILALTFSSASADVSLLGLAFFAGFTVAAVLSLGGLLAGHTGKYAAAAGRYLGNAVNIALIGLAPFLLLAYGIYLRPGLETSLGDTLMMVEWLALLAVLALAGYKIWSFTKQVSHERQYGDLQTLVQKISYDKKHLETASSAVNSFVEQGRKEELIVYITRVLLDNGASHRVIEGIIGGIVNCHDDPEPPIMLRWTKGDIVRRNRERRLAAVTKAVSAGAALAKPEQAAAAASPAKEPALWEKDNISIIT
ncbi:MAG TPA: hypothetical protein VGJ92_05095 [Methanocella sp.]|jgi:hypothetical protein